MELNDKNEIISAVDKYSTELDYSVPEAAIILAAGHGKRIKSHRSKMLHKILEVPTVERVFNACREGIPEINAIVVVGIKAKDVIEAVGKKESTAFAYQEKQKGTGHAVQVALEKLDHSKFNGVVYVLPGDMGLLDKTTMEEFRDKFLHSKADMMVLTGEYEGNPEENSYGRIIRVKPFDVKAKPAGEDEGKVIEIIEHKDILDLKYDIPYLVEYNGNTYSYSKQELIENSEFNSGVYAFDYKKLMELIPHLSGNNAQNEIYITDLISLFNKNGYSVMASSPRDKYVVMGFNNKSVLKEMDNIACRKIYNKLKDIIEIKDRDDFFIHETVVDELIELDKQGVPLDIIIGKGVYIGKGVKLNYNIEFKRNAFVTGNVHFGENVIIWHNVHLSCFSDQTLKIGNYVEILWGDIIKGQIEIGSYSRIESSVNMTGSSEYPVKLGCHVLIKGTSYIFGSVIGDDIHVEHSVLIRKKVERIIKEGNTVQPVKFYLPAPEGVDAVSSIKL